MVLFYTYLLRRCPDTVIIAEVWVKKTELKAYMTLLFSPHHRDASFTLLTA